MRKIRALTSFYDNRYGDATTGDILKVPDNFAREMVEEKGYAEYADEVQDFVEINNVKYPKKFVNKSLPAKFPHIDILREQDYKTFGDLAQVNSYEDEIRDIGESRAEDIKKGFKVVLNKMRD